MTPPRRAALLVLTALLTAPLLGAASAASFSEDFEREVLGDGYTFVRETPSGHRLDQGALRLEAIPGGLAGSRNDARNLLLLDDPVTGDFNFGTSLTLSGGSGDEEAGILFYSDDDRYVFLRFRQGPDGLLADVVTEPPLPQPVTPVPIGPSGDPVLTRSGAGLRAKVVPSSGGLQELASIPWGGSGRLAFVAFNPGTPAQTPGVALFEDAFGSILPAAAEDGAAALAPELEALDAASRAPTRSTSGDLVLSATPAGNVSYVEFLVQGPRDDSPHLVGWAMTPPYEHPLSLRDHRPGEYTLIARAYSPSGASFAETHHGILLEGPRATMGEAIAGLAVGVGVAFAAWGVGFLNPSWLDAFRTLAEGAAEEKLMERTKGQQRARQRLVATALILTAAVALLALFIAYPDAERPEWSFPAYLQSLALAGASVAAVMAAAFCIEAALARRFGAALQVRMWWTGVASLAASSLLAGSPFGTTFVRDGEPEEGRIRRGRFLLGAQAAILVLTLPLALLGRFGSYDLGALGLGAALLIVATNLLPLAPLPGAVIWRWNRVASLAAIVALVGAYLAWQTGLVGLSAMAWLGAGSALAAAALLAPGFRAAPAPLAGPGA